MKVPATTYTTATTPGAIIRQCRRQGVEIFVADEYGPRCWYAPGATHAAREKALSAMSPADRERAEALLLHGFMPVDEAPIGTLRILSPGPLPKDIKTMIQANKAAIFRHLMQPASATQLQKLEAQGKGASPDLTRSQARARLLAPPPRKYAAWELLTDSYHPLPPAGSVAWVPYFGPPRWFFHRASAGQLRYLAVLGVDPPAGATKGECSYAISRLKEKQAHHEHQAEADYQRQLYRQEANEEGCIE